MYVDTTKTKVTSQNGLVNNQYVYLPKQHHECFG